MGKQCHTLTWLAAMALCKDALFLHPSHCCPCRQWWPLSPHKAHPAPKQCQVSGRKCFLSAGQGHHYIFSTWILAYPTAPLGSVPYLGFWAHDPTVPGRDKNLFSALRTVHTYGMFQPMGIHTHLNLFLTQGLRHVIGSREISFIIWNPLPSRTWTFAVLELLTLSLRTLR